MPKTSDIAAHYADGSLLQKIEDGLTKLGIGQPIDPDVLAPVDEFHIGGRLATAELVKKLGLTAANKVLDLGCGLGGPARYIAKTTGAHVKGIDLTDEFVTTGRALTGMAILIDRVDLVQGSILDLPFEDNSFDVAYMIHVGMNITDKAAIAREAARVLKPKGLFAIYDVMQVGTGDMLFPVPWADAPELSALESPEVYRDALNAAGFTIKSETDHTEFATGFFKKLFASQAASDGPPPLGLHLVMGANAGTKVANMAANISEDRIAPIEMIARLTKP